MSPKEVVTLNPLVDPEEHSDSMLMFVNPNQDQVKNIIMKQGNQYTITHQGGIPAMYEGCDVILHQISGILEINNNGRDYTKGFTPVLREATLLYSPVSHPHVQLTLTLDTYAFHVYSTSTVIPPKLQ
jgi:hypothetical protein